MTINELDAIHAACINNELVRSKFINALKHDDDYEIPEEDFPYIKEFLLAIDHFLAPLHLAIYNENAEHHPTPMFRKEL